MFYQRIQIISDGHTRVAVELRAEISKLRAQWEASISSNDIKLVQKVAAVTKRSAKQVNSLKQTIEQQDRDISEINEMAIQVADEYHHLENQRLAETRTTTKQLDHHKNIAAARLMKLNKSQQQVNDLEGHMETIHYKHQQELDDANEQIAALKMQLSKREEEVDTLGSDLAEAIEEISVS